MNNINDINFEKKKFESNKVLKKYPDRVPVIIVKSPNSNLPSIDKNKFLVPKDLTLGQFNHIIRKRIKIHPEIAIFIFINNTLPPISYLISQLYNDYANKDGFLYITYNGESTFGSNIINYFDILNDDLKNMIYDKILYPQNKVLLEEIKNSKYYYDIINSIIYLKNHGPIYNIFELYFKYKYNIENINYQEIDKTIIYNKLNDILLKFLITNNNIYIKKYLYKYFSQIPKWYIDYISNIFFINNNLLSL